MEVVLDNTEHESSLVKTFASYFEKEDYLDVTFVCKSGRQVKAHKLVLSSVSPFLKKMFSEWNGNQDMITILVPDIDHNILKLVFDFVYEGTMKLSKTELNEFKAIQKMLEIRFPGAVVNECNIQVPRNQPPPLLKLDNKIRSGPQRKSAPRNSNATVRKETETVPTPNDDCVLRSDARQPINCVDDSLIPDRRLRDSDDDPLNVPDFYFVPTTSSSSTPQTQGADCNGSGVVPSEGEGHSKLQTTSSSSLAGLRGARPFKRHGAYSSNLRQQSGSSVRKRPYAQTASDTERSVCIPSSVNLEQTQGKMTGNGNKGSSFTPPTDRRANSVTNTRGTQSQRTRTRKAKAVI